MSDDRGSWAHVARLAHWLAEDAEHLDSLPAIDRIARESDVEPGTIVDPIRDFEEAVRNLLEVVDAARRSTWTEVARVAE